MLNVNGVVNRPLCRFVDELRWLAEEPVATGTQENQKTSSSFSGRQNGTGYLSSGTS